MELKICSFETAKLLKEKGFNEYCYEYYSDDIQKDAHLFAMDNPMISMGNHNDDRNVIIEALAPTLDLVCKWLRDEYNVHITLDYAPGDKKYYYIVFNSEESWEKSLEDRVLEYDNYEEAQEVAIIEALKLIR